MRKNFIRILVLALVITGGFIVLRSATNPKKTTDCKDMKQICNKCDKPAISPQKEDMIWENLSRQFSS